MTTQANIPNKWYVPFANGDSSRVEIPVTTSDPTRASQTLGFPPLTMQPPESGGVPPQGEDFNGGMNQIARVCWWVLNGGGWPYDSTFATNANINGYPNGAKLQAADFRGEWISTADGNTNNPDTNGTNWVPGFQYGVTALTGLTGGTVTATPAQASKGTITLAGTLTSALTLILPAWLKNWTITNSTTGAYVVIAKTAAGSGVTIPQNGTPTRVSGDGTNITQAPENIAAATQPTHAMQLGQATGRLLRTSVYAVVSGTQRVSVNGAAFTTTGASTFTALAATNAIDCEVCGGGGGGGGASATTGSQVSFGSGGSCGAYGRAYLTSGFSPLNVFIGAGGAGGATGNNGGTGGFATNINSGLLVAPGGSSGAGGGAVATGGNGSFNAPPGQSAACSGTATYYVNMQGPVGFAGLFAGGSSNPQGGFGGSGQLGAGGNTVQGSNGANGSGYGSGGSGGAQQQSSAGAAGGAGASGCFIVREYA